MLAIPDLTAVRDWCWWGVLAALATAESLVIGDFGPWPWLIAWLVALRFIVGYRQSQPLIAFAATSVFMIVEVIAMTTGDTGFRISYLAVLVLVSYAVGRFSDTARGFVILLVVAELALGVTTFVAYAAGPLVGAGLTWLSHLTASLVFVVLPWLYGRYRRQHTRLVSAGWERAERLEAAQRMELAQTRLRERTRIAQDMHDSLGHELSLIALRAGALEVDAELAPRHREAIRELRSAAANATERLGEMVRVLRTEDGDVRRPVTASLERILERARDSGLTIEFESTGEAATLAPLAEQTVDRVAEEALTNAAKHAPGEQVHIARVWETDAVAVSVRNPLPPTGAAVNAPSGRHGLIGLTERLRVIGGELSYHRTDDAFVLTARIPYEPAVSSDPGEQLIEQSETSTQHDTARRRTSSRLRTAIAAPVLIGVVLSVVGLGYYYVLSQLAILEASDYERIEVGETRERLDGVLPSVQMIDAPTDVSKPPGTQCEYYRSAGAFSGTFAYRLCFDDDTLVAKAKVPTGDRSLDR